MKKYTILLLSIAALTGCSRLTAIDGDGNPQDNLVWPDVSRDITMDNKQGSYGILANIMQIKAGASRDQVYQSIGRPHFSEGFHVREWDYLFHFPQPNGEEYHCQYKILFNRHKEVAHTYWKPVNDSDRCPSQ